MKIDLKKAKRPKFTIDFKKDAANLVIQQGYTRIEAATSLGVSLCSINRWVQAEQADSSKSRGGKRVASLSDQEEIRLLRKEVIRLKQEREILKKAAVFFAQQTE